MSTLRICFALPLVSLLLGCGKAGDTPQAQREIQAPPSQATLLRIVTAAQVESRAAENDMQRGGIKSRRDKSLCEAISTLDAENWIGTVKSISSNSDGKGVLEIEIAPDVLVKTWNNELSDILSHTLIEPGSPVFETASAMKPGQKVLFSGRFFQGTDGDCLGEASLTLRGKLRQPEFIFRFADVRDYEQKRARWVTQQSQPTPTPAPPARVDTTSESHHASSSPAPQLAAAATASSPVTADDVSENGALMLCATTRHAISIDRDPATNLVRYRSWNRPKDQSEKPDMQVQPGEIVIAGTGACRTTTYRFKTGNTGFEVTRGLDCVEGRPPENAVGQLSVLIGGEMKSQYWCLR